MSNIPTLLQGCKHGAADSPATPAADRSPPASRAFAAVVLAAIVAAATLLAFSHPFDALGSGGCPTRRFLGLYCPGCGSLRCTHALLTGDPSGAWRHNPAMIVAGLPAAVWLAIAATFTLVTGRSLTPPWRIRPAVLWTVAALLIGWGVVRNIPARTLDWTRPPDSSSTDATSKPLSAPVPTPRDE